MAFLMAAMLVLGVSASPLTQVFAASATKKLKSGDVTVELDKSCAATNVSVDIKTAAEGLHDMCIIILIICLVITACRE